jgi:hypothetical protein
MPDAVSNVMIKCSFTPNTTHLPCPAAPPGRTDIDRTY